MKPTTAQQKLAAIHRRKIAVLSGFGALLVILIVARLRGGPAPAAAAPQMPAVQQNAETPKAPLAKTPEQPDWPTGLDRDPFERETPGQTSNASSQDAKALQSLELKSILYAKVSRVLINDRVLLEGDSIEGFVIRKINPRSVILERGGVTAQLDL